MTTWATLSRRMKACAIHRLISTQHWIHMYITRSWLCLTVINVSSGDFDWQFFQCSDVVWVTDYPCKPVPEETFAHLQLSWSSTIPYQLPPSTTIHSILPVQFTCLQFFCTTCLQVFFGIPLGLDPSTLYSIHFFTKLLSSFRNTWPYHHNLFCCSTDIMSSNPSLSTLLGTLSFTLMPHIHLTILISALWCATHITFYGFLGFCLGLPGGAGISKVKPRR